MLFPIDKKKKKIVYFIAKEDEMNQCIICKKYFKPDKFHPHQKVCKSRRCKREYKKTYNRIWWQKNPGYNNGKWTKKRAREYYRNWRKENPDYHRKYYASHPELKNRIREAVKKYREKLKLKRILI